MSENEDTRKNIGQLYEEKFQREYLYSGLIGYFNKMQHRYLTPKSLLNKNKVLEIGPSYEPHCKHASLSFDEYHCIDVNDSIDIKSFYKKNFNNVKFITYDGKNIPYENQKFDRINISHCLEHIEDPEKFIIEMFRVLKGNGVISIALPCDNGFLWRLGRFLLKKTFIKKKGILELDYDYQMAKEHKNTIFQLRTILRKKFKIKEEKFLPFSIKSPDFNLYYICQITKKY